MNFNCVKKYIEIATITHYFPFTNRRAVEIFHYTESTHTHNAINLIISYTTARICLSSIRFTKIGRKSFADINGFVTIS